MPMKSTMHPPIPPNCKYFVVEPATGKQRFRADWSIWTRPPIFDECLDDPSDSAIPFIAAVARCAWLDTIGNHEEFKKWHAQNPHLPYGCYTFQQGWVRHCNDNAEAWRKWGEAEIEKTPAQSRCAKCGCDIKQNDARGVRIGSDEALCQVCVANRKPRPLIREIGDQEFKAEIEKK